MRPSCLPSPSDFLLSGSRIRRGRSTEEEGGGDRRVRGREGEGGGRPLSDIEEVDEGTDDR
jgi:hypothetical protein